MGLKKILKKAAKAAKKVAKVGVPVGAAYLAAKAMGRDKGVKVGDNMPRSSVYWKNREPKGLNLPEGTNMSGWNSLAEAGGADKMMAKGGRVTKSKGVGIAKRGFGRAMKKGRK